MTTPHMQSFVLISMLRGQPKTPPSGDDLAVLDYHLNSTFQIQFLHLTLKNEMYLVVVGRHM